jgi:hypothetical protein
MAEGLVLNEQRNMTRRELIYYLKITDRLSHRELGRLGDIHGEGLLIFGEKPLKIGAVYDVTMELPKALWEGDRKKELDFKFEAVWTRPGPKNSTYHESGGRFIKLDADRRAVIEQLIELYAMPGQ